jgi:hypothetical protein
MLSDRRELIGGAYVFGAVRRTSTISLFEVTKSLWMRGTLPGTGNEFCFPDSVTSRPVLPAHSHPRKLRCGFGLPGRDLFSVLPWLSRHPFLRLKELSDAGEPKQLFRAQHRVPQPGFADIELGSLPDRTLAFAASLHRTDE